MHVHSVRAIVGPTRSYTLTSGTTCLLNFSVETYETSSGATHLEVSGGSVGH